MFLFNAYCFFLKLYLRVRTCICNFHFPHGDKCIRGIVHIFVIFSAKYEIFHNLQLLQRTLLSNFTKYKNIQNTKKVQNVSQFAASTKDTSKQFYKIQKKYKYSTICSFYNGHFQASLHCEHSHYSNLLGSYFLWTSLGFFAFFIRQSSLIMFSVDIVHWQPSQNMYVENLE